MHEYVRVPSFIMHISLLISFLVRVSSRIFCLGGKIVCED